MLEACVSLTPYCRESLRLTGDGHNAVDRSQMAVHRKMYTMADLRRVRATY